VNDGVTDELPVLSLHVDMLPSTRGTVDSFADYYTTRGTSFRSYFSGDLSVTWVMKGLETLNIDGPKNYTCMLC
jgi:hypothetical protein